MCLNYIEALKYGLTSTGGMEIDIDRLVMLLTAQESIQNFSRMRNRIIRR